jgi:methionyl aminopeptidase
MIHIKNSSEIEKMREGGKILGDVLSTLVKEVKPGMSEAELDKLAEKLIIERGGEPGFKKVAGYKHTLCIATNHVVVHGIPGSYVFKEGDVVGIDCGVYFKGFHTDMSESVVVGKSNDKNVSHFLEIGKKALNLAIDQAVAGKRVGNISEVIQNIVEGEGYSVVKSLIGHGVGKKLHEEPEVPGFIFDDIKKTPLLKEGMTIAIEIIYNMGSDEVIYTSSDGWTIGTKDGFISGLFERTVLITDTKPEILTKLL